MATKKIKIALLLNAPWGIGIGTSGGDQRLMQIFSRIGGNFDIDIYTTCGGKKTLENQLPNARYYIANRSFDKYGVFLSYYLRSRWVSKEIIKRNYQLIYSGSDFFPDVVPAYKYRRLNSNSRWLQCIFHIYPNWWKRPGKKVVNLVGTLMQNYSFSKIRRLADKIININEQVRHNLVKKRRFNQEKIIVNPCGVDLDYFDKIKAQKKPYQAVFLARLSPSKGIFDLVKIWRLVVAKLPEAKLKIIGGGKQKIKNKLRDQFKRFSISNNVKICGFLADTEAYKIVKESQLLIFPSHEEGFGMAIAEALACATPAIVWNLPVYKEVFPRGLTSVSIGDYKKFASAVVKLLSNKKILKQLALEGKSVVKQYNWDEIAEEELKITKTLIVNYNH